MLHIVWSKENSRLRLIKFRIKALPLLPRESLTVKVLVGSTNWIITIKAYARTIIIVKWHVFPLIKQVLDSFRFRNKGPAGCPKRFWSKGRAPLRRTGSRCRRCCHVFTGRLLIIESAKDGIRWVNIQHTWPLFHPFPKLETPDQIQCFRSKLSNSNKIAWTESWTLAMFKCVYIYNMTYADLFLMILWLLLLNFPFVLVIVRFRIYMEPKVRCLFLSSARWFKVFIFTLSPGTQHMLKNQPLSFAAARHGSQKCLRAQQNLVETVGVKSPYFSGIHMSLMCGCLNVIGRIVKLQRIGWFHSWSSTVDQKVNNFIAKWSNVDRMGNRGLFLLRYVFVSIFAAASFRWSDPGACWRHLWVLCGDAESSLRR